MSHPSESSVSDPKIIVEPVPRTAISWIYTNQQGQVCAQPDNSVTEQTRYNEILAALPPLTDEYVQKLFGGASVEALSKTEDDEKFAVWRQTILTLNKSLQELDQICVVLNSVLAHVHFDVHAAPQQSEFETTAMLTKSHLVKQDALTHAALRLSQFQQSLQKERADRKLWWSLMERLQNAFAITHFPRAEEPFSYAIQLSPLHACHAAHIPRLRAILVFADNKSIDCRLSGVELTETGVSSFAEFLSGQGFVHRILSSDSFEDIASRLEAFLRQSQLRYLAHFAFRMFSADALSSDMLHIVDVSDTHLEVSVGSNGTVAVSLDASCQSAPFPFLNVQLSGDASYTQWNDYVSYSLRSLHLRYCAQSIAVHGSPFFTYAGVRKPIPNNRILSDTCVAVQHRMYAKLVSDVLEDEGCAVETAAYTFPDKSEFKVYVRRDRSRRPALLTVSVGRVDASVRTGVQPAERIVTVSDLESLVDIVASHEG